MSSHSSNIGAPDSMVLKEQVTLLQVKLVQQSIQTSGSDMLLLVDVQVGNVTRQFLVGGYWSTQGFTLTTMVELGRVAPSDATRDQGETINLHGVTLSKPNAVIMDRVQQAVNNQDVGRPENPSEAFTRRKSVADWSPQG